MPEKIGPYRILGELGRGGMGVVYKAHDDSLKRDVAIKVLSDDLNHDETFVARFLREAQSAAQLNHPNITQIYFIGEDDGRHYFVMEFIRGRSLHQIIRAEGAQPIGRAAELMRQTAAGLAVAHDRGVIHRDIKPANLVINEDGLVKIADFGLAIIPMENSRLTSTGSLMGTPGYLSPEQCMGESPDARTDIYSLGVSYYETVSGTMPFKAESPLALVRKVCEVIPLDVRQLNQNVDGETAAILERMMAKKREDRYQTCHELHEALDAYLGHAKTTAAAPRHAVVAVVQGAVATAKVGQANVQTEQSMPVDADDGPATTELGALHAEPATVELGTRPQALAKAAPGAIEAADTEPAVEATRVAPGAIDKPISGPPARRGLKLALGAALVAVPLFAAGVWFVAGALDGDDESVAVAMTLPDEAAGIASPVADPVAAIESGTTTPEMTIEATTETSSAASETMAVASGEPGTVTKVASSSVAATSGSVVAVPNPRVARKPASRVQPTEPRQVPAQTVAVPLPATPFVVVLAQGEPSIAVAFERQLEEALAAHPLEVVDENNTVWHDELRGVGTLRDYLELLGRERISVLVRIEAEVLGERTLRHIGGVDSALTTEVRVNAFVVDDQRPLGPGWKHELEYTTLNAGRKAEAAVVRSGDDIAEAIVNGWAAHRRRSGR